MPANLPANRSETNPAGKLNETAEDVARGGDEADAGVADAQRGLELRQDQQGA